MATQGELYGSSVGDNREKLPTLPSTATEKSSALPSTRVQDSRPFKPLDHMTNISTAYVSPFADLLIATDMDKGYSTLPVHSVVSSYIY